MHAVDRAFEPADVEGLRSRPWRQVEVGPLGILGFRCPKAVPVYQPQQDLVSERLPAHSGGRLDHRVGLVGPEVVAPNMQTFVDRSAFAHSCNPLICIASVPVKSLTMRYSSQKSVCIVRLQTGTTFGARTTTEAFCMSRGFGGAFPVSPAVTPGEILIGG
jgi:hypothetical protein